MVTARFGVAGTVRTLTVAVLLPPVVPSGVSCIGVTSSMVVIGVGVGVGVGVGQAGAVAPSAVTIVSPAFRAGRQNGPDGVKILTSVVPTLKRRPGVKKNGLKGSVGKPKVGPKRPPAKPLMPNGST